MIEITAKLRSRTIEITGHSTMDNQSCNSVTILADFCKILLDCETVLEDGYTSLKFLSYDDFKDVCSLYYLMSHKYPNQIKYSEELSI